MGYAVHSTCFSPANLGLPVSRNRRYTMLIRKSCIQLKHTFDWSKLQYIFGRQLECAGRIFFRAPTSLLRKLKVADETPETIRNQLTLGDANRLGHHSAEARRQGKVSVCITARQNVDYC
eukprot:8821587-Prorocentrum_lima.AAC.1